MDSVWEKVGQVEPHGGRYSRAILSRTAAVAAYNANLLGLDAAYIIATAGGYSIVRLRDVPVGQQAVKVDTWGNVYKQKSTNQKGT
ncbi:hypothetical protein EBZ39_09385 [bacterium]|nr:hypothetical protein [bacterium]